MNITTLLTHKEAYTMLGVSMYKFNKMLEDGFPQVDLGVKNRTRTKIVLSHVEEYLQAKKSNVQ